MQFLADNTAPSRLIGSAFAFGTDALECMAQHSCVEEAVCVIC